jgi:signal transduction histidine kinase
MTSDAASTRAIGMQCTEVPVRALLEAAVAPLRGQAEAKDVSLTSIVDDDVPQRCVVDGPKCAWAISTLVGNALRFVRAGSRLLPGGTIDVRIHMVSPSVTETVVADDGPGITAERLATLFDPRPDGLPSGAVALSLVRDVARAHGGDLSLESRADGTHGTIARLRLPLG